jgi:hypothetical protein
MRIQRWLTATAAILVGAALGNGAQAQLFGIVNLPSNDFTWTWGDLERSERRGFEDFSARGNEGGFSCELTGKLRPGSRMSTGETRQLQEDLRTSLFFVQNSTNTMNYLDQSLELDWAILACAKSQGAEEDAEKTAERVEKAREKAVQKMLDERARREKRGE